MTAHALGRLSSPRTWLASACLTGMIGCAEPVEDQLPLSAALDYVYRHPEYVIADPDAELLASAQPTDDDAELDRHLAGDWVARTLAEHGLDDPNAIDSISWAQQAVAITRETLLSQRDPELYLLADDCACDKHFDDTTFARLVRGFSNCDGVNHLAALLLHAREPKIRLRHLDSPSHDNDHTIAVMPGDDGSIFVDAWADFGLMVLSDDVAPGVTTYDELEPPDEPTHGGIYPRDAYEHTRRLPRAEMFFGLRHPEGPDLTIPAALPPIRDARDAYLRGRVFELYGLRDEALPLYQQAADMSCVDTYAPICRLANAHLPRSQLSALERIP